MARYFIPKPITQQYELFPGSGWGLTEVGLVASGLGAGFAGVVLGSYLGWPVPWRLVLGGVLVALGVGLALPAPGQGPLYHRLQAWWDYRHRPRLLLYEEESSPDSLRR